MPVIITCVEPNDGAVMKRTDQGITLLLRLHKSKSHLLQVIYILLMFFGLVSFPYQCYKLETTDNSYSKTEAITSQLTL